MIWWTGLLSMKIFPLRNDEYSGFYDTVCTSMAVTGFVFGMVLLCALGVGMAAAGIIWLVVQRKSRQAKERKGRLVLPILLLIMGLLCAGLPGGYFVAISHAKGEREQSRGALVTAIEKDPFDVDTVRNLLDGGMDPDGGTESGYTPRMAASFRQGTDVMALLVKAGADVNAQDRAGHSALMFACSPPAGHLPDPEGILLLLKSGADRALKDNNGETAYSYLMMRAEDDRETLKKLPERLAAYEKAVAAVKPE